MKLPKAAFAGLIRERCAFYFQSDNLHSDEPHYFIVLKRTAEEIVLMSCCTSQRKKREQFLIKNNIDFSTLVWIPQAPENPLTRETFVDCNSVHLFHVSELVQKYEEGVIDMETHTYWKISETSYEQIIIGIHNSPLIEEEIKALLPKP